MAWAFAFGKPIMTFREVSEGEIEREDKRERLPGTIVQDVKRIITTDEIGKATITSVDTAICDDAEKTVNDDMLILENEGR